MTEVNLDHFESPIGTLMIAWVGDGLCALGFDDREERMAASLKARFGKIALTKTDDSGRFKRPLEEYFAGDLTALDRIPVDTGGTPFQQRVWQMLRQIPAGKTATYGELALKLSSLGAARAVGLANAVNPVAVVVPCHRVIGADGRLVGYGGGLDRKRWLLSHEAMRGTLQVACTPSPGRPATAP